MVDSLKITSPIVPRDNVHNLPKHIPTEGVFDLTNPSVVIKSPPKGETTEKNPFEHNLLQHLNKDIYAPLFKDTRALAESLKKMVLLSKSPESSAGKIPLEMMQKLFIDPKEMLKALLERENGETVFSGGYFDNLRILVNAVNQPKLKDAITTVLKYFDSFVNQENSLEAITSLNKNLPELLLKADKATVEAKIDEFSKLLAEMPENRKEIMTFLKKEYIPVLSNLVKRYHHEEKIRNTVMAIIHNVVRLDKGDPQRLEAALLNLNDELRTITNLSEENLDDLKEMLYFDAKVIKGKRPAREQAERAPGTAQTAATEAAGAGEGDKDLATLLSKALDKTETANMNKAAQNLLSYLVQSESPVLPIMHFMLPIKFGNDNTYGEFFIDKNCEERKGDAKEAKNIFFVIQSDRFGTFEVDLLAKDLFVEVGVRCPEALIEDIKNIKGRMREIIEGQGYRLSQYQVDRWNDSQTILQRFPKFALRKAGVDVKV